MNNTLAKYNSELLTLVKSLIVQGNSRKYDMEISPCLLSKILAWAANIRLGYKWQTVANTLAYYKLKLLTDIKSFVAQANAN
jgi:hypothetical protein